MPKTTEPHTPESSVDTTKRQTAASQHHSGENKSTNDETPKLPHERDQSVDMTHGEPDSQVEQAYRDVKRGLQDTDRGQVADQAYQKQKS